MVFEHQRRYRELSSVRFSAAGQKLYSTQAHGTGVPETNRKLVFLHRWTAFLKASPRWISGSYHTLLAIEQPIGKYRSSGSLITSKQYRLKAANPLALIHIQREIPQQTVTNAFAFQLGLKVPTVRRNSHY